MPKLCDHWFDPRRQLIYRLAHGLTEVAQFLPVHSPVKGSTDICASSARGRRSPVSFAMRVLDMREPKRVIIAEQKETHPDRREDDADGTEMRPWLASLSTRPPSRDSWPRWPHSASERAPSRRRRGTWYPWSKLEVAGRRRRGTRAVRIERPSPDGDRRPSCHIRRLQTVPFGEEDHIHSQGVSSYVRMTDHLDSSFGHNALCSSSRSSCRMNLHLFWGSPTVSCSRTHPTIAPPQASGIAPKYPPALFGHQRGLFITQTAVIRTWLSREGGLGGRPRGVV
jgi:hypothetical protein